MIRPATPKDIPALVDLFQKQHAEMGCSWSIDASTLAGTFSQAITAPDWLCLTGDGCLLLAACFESPLGAGRIAQELCFCVTPGNLDGLLRFYEDWARSRGCRTASVACEQRHQAFARLYGRHGYALAESTFSKVL